jgi:quinol monooxygenase YgiN
LRAREKPLNGPIFKEIILIVVLATIELHAGRRDDFLAEFRQIVPLVRKEAGCIEYFPAVDQATALPAHGPVGQDTVIVCEKWDSIAALEAHLIAQHMMQYRPKVKDFVKKTSLQVLTPVE